MRYVAAVVMLLLAAAAFLSPAPVPEEHGPTPGTEVPPVSICPVVSVGERTTTVSVLSSVNGVGRMSTFAAGEETGAFEFRTGGSGSVTFAAADAGAVGVSGGLIEMPSSATASGVLITGESARFAESCADIPTGQSFLSGGSTASGSQFEVQLLNPYAGEAVVDLTVTSDAGIESDESFDAVIVPALSTITLDMGEIIPGREDISVNVEVTSGSALAVARQTIEGRGAMWRAVEPAQDWWLPIPEGGATKLLLLSNPSGSEVEYQVDYYGSGGLEESFESGVIQPRTNYEVDLAAISETTAGIRVITTAPLVPTLWMSSAEGLAITTGSAVDAPVWLLPGASAPPGGAGAVVILNTGIEDVSLDVRSLLEASITRNFTLPSEGVLDVSLVAADGYRVEASGPIVALWTSRFEGTSTAAIGIPLEDG